MAAAEGGTSIEVGVVNKTGKKTGSCTLSSAVFAKKVKGAVLHQTVRWQRAKKRSGTHSVLTRAEMTGGGRKPWKQKGTGNARAGSNTSPLWVGGGIAHGPKPRDYEFQMNKKERRQALCAALTTRREEERLLVVSGFEFSEAKTRAANELLRAVGIPVGKKGKGGKTLVVVDSGDETASKSFRNIEGVKVIFAEGINVYDVLNHPYVVFSEKALQAIDARLSK